MITLIVLLCLLSPIRPLYLQMHDVTEFAQDRFDLGDKRVSVSFLAQSSFDEVTFWAFDTAGYIVNTDPDYPSQMFWVARCPSGKIHQIAGCDTCEFNQILDEEPLALTCESIVKYAEMYVAFTRQYFNTYDNLYFVENKDAFIEYTETIAAHGRTAACSHCLDELRPAILTALADSRVGEVRYDYPKKQYELDVVYQDTYTGELNRVVLEITREGRVTELSDELLVRQVGCFSSNMSGGMRREECE